MRRLSARRARPRIRRAVATVAVPTVLESCRNVTFRCGVAAGETFHWAAAPTLTAARWLLTRLRPQLPQPEWRLRDRSAPFLDSLLGVASDPRLPVAARRVAVMRGRVLGDRLDYCLDWDCPPGWVDIFRWAVLRNRRDFAWVWHFRAMTPWVLGDGFGAWYRARAQLVARPHRQ